MFACSPPDAALIDVAWCGRSALKAARWMPPPTLWNDVIFQLLAARVQESGQCQGCLTHLSESTQRLCSLQLFTSDRVSGTQARARWSLCSATACWLQRCASPPCCTPAWKLRLGVRRRRSSPLEVAAQICLPLTS